MQKRDVKIGNEVRRIVEQAKREILADVTSGTVPHTCASFSELHDYTDANGYGGAFERPFDNTKSTSGTPSRPRLIDGSNRAA